MDATQPAQQPVFKLFDASVHGEAVLLPDPGDWRALEADRLTESFGAQALAHKLWTRPPLKIRLSLRRRGFF